MASIGPFVSEDDFSSFFWKDSARLIGVLNVSKVKEREHRTLQTYGLGQAPCIYGVVVNRSIVEDDKYHFWKLLKIGKTEVDTKPDSTRKNRMESIQKIALDWCKKKVLAEGEEEVEDEEFMVSILFVLRVATGTAAKAEEDVRQAVGLQISKALGKKLELPVHTEWVLTSQAYIKILRDLIDDTVMQGGECTTDLLVGNEFQKKRKVEDIQRMFVQKAEEGAAGPGKKIRVAFKVKIEKMMITHVDNPEIATGSGMKNESEVPIEKLTKTVMSTTLGKGATGSGQPTKSTKEGKKRGTAKKGKVTEDDAA